MIDIVMIHHSNYTKENDQPDNIHFICGIRNFMLPVLDNCLTQNTAVSYVCGTAGLEMSTAVGKIDQNDMNEYLVMKAY